MRRKKKEIQTDTVTEGFAEVTAHTTDGVDLFLKEQSRLAFQVK